jgi:SAM-dependent methyltransferase
MYLELLGQLCCPACPGERLTLEPGAHIDEDESAVHSGKLRCAACARRYRIAHGIVDLLGLAYLPDSPAQVSNFLPPTAWAYERTWRPRALSLLTGEPFGYARELPLLRELMQPQRGGLYIDVACSNGLYARALAEGLHSAPGHVVGIDHAWPMLRQARSFAQRAGLRISYIRARAQALPFAEGTAAGVAMGGSLNEIGDAAGSLREMRRVLAPAGRCVLMNLLRAEQPAGRALQRVLAAGGIRFWTLAQLNARLEAAALRRVAQWRYGVVAFSLLLPAQAAHLPR